MYKTCSLQVAKELYDTTQFEGRTDWIYDIPGHRGAEYNKEVSYNSTMKFSYIRPKPILPAPQVHEILLYLPTKIKSAKNVFFLQVEFGEDGITVGYFQFKEDGIVSRMNVNIHDAFVGLYLWYKKHEKQFDV